MIKHKKHGFTLLELMMFFLFATLILAASVPLITKKFKEVPNRFSHGLYMCYRDTNGSLTERYYNSSKNTVETQNVTQCKFNAPKRAALYKFEVIGAGAGGYDFWAHEQETVTDGGGYEPKAWSGESLTCITGNLVNCIIGFGHQEIYEKFNGASVKAYAFSGNAGDSGEIRYTYTTPNAKQNYKTCLLDDPNSCYNGTVYVSLGSGRVYFDDMSDELKDLLEQRIQSTQEYLANNNRDMTLDGEVILSDSSTDLKVDAVPGGKGAEIESETLAIDISALLQKKNTYDQCPSYKQMIDRQLREQGLTELPKGSYFDGVQNGYLCEAVYQPVLAYLSTFLNDYIEYGYIHKDDPDIGFVPDAPGPDADNGDDISITLTGPGVIKANDGKDSEYFAAIKIAEGDMHNWPIIPPTTYNVTQSSSLATGGVGKILKVSQSGGKSIETDNSKEEAKDAIPKGGDRAELIYPTITAEMRSYRRTHTLGSGGGAGEIKLARYPNFKDDCVFHIPSGGEPTANADPIALTTSVSCNNGSIYVAAKGGSSKNPLTKSTSFIAEFDNLDTSTLKSTVTWNASGESAEPSKYKNKYPLTKQVLPNIPFGQGGAPTTVADNRNAACGYRIVTFHDPAGEGDSDIINEVYECGQDSTLAGISPNDPMKTPAGSGYGGAVIISW